MRYREQRRVRFGHSDPAGIVFYPRFFEWFHDIMEDVFEAALGVPYRDVIQTRRIGFPAVATRTEFRRPAAFGELVEVEAFFSRLSERSLTIEYRVRREGTLLALAQVKVASMDLDKRVSMPFPEDIAAGLSKYLDEDDEAFRSSGIP